MSSSFHILLLFCSILFLLSPSNANSKTLSSFKPKALVLPIIKDSNTSQYITYVNQRTPLVPVKYTLDLGGQFPWVDTDIGYVSSTYKPAHCGSAQCSIAPTVRCGDCSSTQSPGCNNKTCRVLPDNTIDLRIMNSGEVAIDILSIQSTDGSNPTKLVTFSNFVFGCGSSILQMLDNLANDVKGMVGLGRLRMGLPSQFSSAFNFPKKFAICLSPSTTSNGVVFFGNSPYVFHPGNIDISQKLTYTPLLRNLFITASFPFSKLFPSSEYFIGVKSIKINGNIVPLNTSLLKIDNKGIGGTKISTVNPYTVLEPSIYKSFIEVFAKQLGKDFTKVAPIAPFGLCYNSKSLGTGTGIGMGCVPPIDLVLQNEDVVWRILGENSMVKVSNEVVCLGFVVATAREESGPRMTSIIIGGHQLEDNLLQFDLDSNRLGFSSSLLLKQTTCSNFNFTSN
ncbi:basic 7S globulin-like [Quillaja saponaria]|uniref:Basic 7S globulin-like n=1 Tax=Quillaja saponaria TaxID=32244 RepID=A0AAD7PMT2_QUISA|nr:basic 7S globulin-like [Quillaja saponaria]